MLMDIFKRFVECLHHLRIVTMSIAQMHQMGSGACTSLLTQRLNGRQLAFFTAAVKNRDQQIIRTILLRTGTSRYDLKILFFVALSGYRFQLIPFSFLNELFRMKTKHKTASFQILIPCAEAVAARYWFNVYL